MSTERLSDSSGESSLISSLVSSIKPSATIAMNTKANELIRAGVNVISLSTGEPDFDTPDLAKRAAVKAMDSGFTKYTSPDGIIELKEAVCKKFERDNHISYSTSEVTVASGAKQVIFNALISTINPGDEVIIPAPYWVSYPDMVTLFGGKPVIANTDQSAEFKISAKQLSGAITPKTKWLILNSPSNPTGQLYSREQLLDIAKVLSANPHVYVISDDIYEHLVYDDGLKFETLASVAPELQDRVLTVNGVSKSYAMTGWRIGFAGIKNPELISAMRKVQSQSTSNPCSIAQYAAVSALNDCQSFIEESKEVFRRRRDFVYDKLSELPGISLLKPQGAFYVFFSIESLIGKASSDGKHRITNCESFASYLLDEVSVATVHGAAFGADGFIRISYATSDDNLSEALSRISGAVERLT